MHRFLATTLSIATILISAMLMPASIHAQSGVQVARAEYQQLELTLRVHTSGSTVYARATLQNTASSPFSYYGACAPPVLQIQARDEQGHRVFGYAKPRISCLALSLMHLGPGQTIIKQARFSANGTITLYAKVPAGSSPKKLFTTPALTVTLPDSTMPSAISTRLD